MSSPFITIDLEAVKHNALSIKSKVKQKRVLSMVKADAYGHGLVEVSKTLENIVDVLGVARMDEAITLRNAGIKIPILLMTGIYCIEDLQLAIRLKLDLVLHQQKHLDLLEQLPEDSAKPHVWIKVASTMHRLGYRLQDIPQVMQRLKALNMHEPEAFMTHLPAVEDDSTDSIKQQLQPFLDQIKPYGRPLSISNSAGIISHHDYMLEVNDIFRPGRIAYGLSPSNHIPIESLDLKPVMSFFATVIAKDTVLPGETIGYERAYTVEKNETIAIVNVGYGDGYPKTTKGFVRFKQFDCPVRGWVSMDMMAISIPEGCEIELGDTVQLWGQGMPVELISQHIGRSSTDIVMPLATRVKRVYIPVTHTKLESYEKETI